MGSQMNFGDWMAVITNSITAITAVIMAVLAYRTYLKTPEQEAEPEKETAPANLESTLTQITVFKTSKQETILKVTENGLECHLKDTRQGKGGHQWTINKFEAKKILDTSNFFVNTGYKVNTGTFSIGQRRNWLYSKKLFPAPEYLRSSIKELLSNTV